MYEHWLQVDSTSRILITASIATLLFLLSGFLITDRTRISALRLIAAYAIPLLTILCSDFMISWFSGSTGNGAANLVVCVVTLGLAMSLLIPAARGISRKTGLVLFYLVTLSLYAPFLLLPIGCLWYRQCP